MRKVFFILLSLLLLPVVFASVNWFDPSQQTQEATNMVKQFLYDFRYELASLSIAAVAAVGLQMAIGKYGKLAKGRSLNMVTVVLFISIFLMVYVSGWAQYFIPFVGFLTIAGVGVILFALYKGLHDNEVKPWDSLVGIGGCFFLALFSLNTGNIFLFLIFATGSVIFVFKLLIDLKEVVGLGEGQSWRDFLTGTDSEPEVDPDLVSDPDNPDLPADLTACGELIDEAGSEVEEAISSIESAGNQLTELLNDLAKELGGAP